MRHGLAGLAMAIGLKARAAVWENPEFALAADATATVGYDSNLFAVADGPGDAFLTLRPLLDLSRKDTPYSLKAEAWFDWTSFLRLTNDDSVDPGFRVTFDYPPDAETLPTQTAEAHWIRTTQANVDVGQRVTQEDGMAKYEGDVYDNGKTVVAGRVSLDRDQFLGEEFDTNETASAGATASYLPNSAWRAGLGYDFTLGRSVSNSGATPDLDLVENAFTLQSSGEFSPKLTGKVYAGGAYSDYTGSYDRADWDLITGVALTWSPLERLAVSLKAARAPSFNPDGDVDVASSLSLDVLQELSGGVALHGGVLGGHTSHVRTMTFRTDNFVGAGAGLSYNLTGRLIASIEYSWTSQDSSVPVFTYRRQLVAAKADYSL